MRTPAPLGTPAALFHSPESPPLALSAASQIPIDPNTRVILGTSKGEIDDWFNHRLSPHGLSNLSNVIAQNLNLRQLPQIISAACASGLVALIHAALLIQRGIENRVLVIAAESSFHPILLHSYERLGVLTPSTCKPFDQHRDGFFVGEAAAAILLEAKTPIPGDILIDKTALASDALSITAPDPSAIGLKSVATQLRLHLHEVDLIHAHGTGTLLNDAIEWDVYDSLIHKPTNVFSHKAALGHTLGAAGLLGAVLTVQMMQKKQILPTPTPKTPSPPNTSSSPNTPSTPPSKKPES